MGKAKSLAAIEARRRADILEARDAFLERRGIRLSDGMFSGGVLTEILVDFDKRLLALWDASARSHIKLSLVESSVNSGIKSNQEEIAAQAVTKGGAKRIHAALKELVRAYEVRQGAAGYYGPPSSAPHHKVFIDALWEAKMVLGADYHRDTK